MRGAILWLALAPIVALLGCGGKPPPVDRFKVKVAKDGQGYNLATAAYLPPLDGERLEFAAPAGWKTLPRSPESLAEFDHGNVNVLPRIKVIAQESRHAGFETLTDKNVAALAKKLDKELFATKAESIIEPAKPMIIGGVPCVRYVMRFNVRTVVERAYVVNHAELQVLETIHANRLYRVELRVLEGTILEHRDASYAVLSSFKFHEQEAAGEADAAPEPAKEAGGDSLKDQIQRTKLKGPNPK
jgi:hypothetical protein